MCQGPDGVRPRGGALAGPAEGGAAVHMRRRLAQWKEGHRWEGGCGPSSLSLLLLASRQAFHLE